MEAHDYVGGDDHCLICGRTPGNYLHAGLSDAEYQRAGWEARTGRGQLEATEPPLALMEYQTLSP